MSIHKLGGGDLGGKLVLSWMELDSDTKKISVQLSTNGELTENYHHFLLPNLPKMSGVTLAVSKGPWFFRVGAWKTLTNDISWSGVLGPLEITTERGMKNQEKGEIKVIHTQAIEDGMRIHTGMTKKYSVLVEASTDSSFTPAKTKYKFITDNNIRGYIDVLGLDSSHSYFIRLGQVNEIRDTVEEPKEWIVLKGMKSLPPRRHFTPADRTIHQAEKALLQEARERPMRFSSGADYANYLAAQEKAKASLSRPN